MGFYDNVVEDSLSSTPFDKEHICLFTTVEYKIEDIVVFIREINNKSDEEISKFIKSQYSVILNYDLFLESSETRAEAQRLFTNIRFLKIFFDVVGSLKLAEQEKKCINKLAYDYYIMKDRDDNISSLLFNITAFVNNLTIIQLTPYLGHYGATILAMLANSSFKIEKNVHRTNTFLIRSEIELSAESIIGIYMVLFRSNFKHLFSYTMLETKEGLDSKYIKTFDNISSAILTILNNQTSHKIYAILSNYGYVLNMVSGSEDTVRFPLNTPSCPIRVLEVIKDIERTDLYAIKIP